MRDTGLSAAIEAAGGVVALAKGLGISQPSVSGWSRIPVERVAAVSELTGLSRATLRPDLFDDTAGDPTVDLAGDLAGDGGLDLARARHYLLVASLLRTPPSEQLLSDIASLTGDASPIGMATIRLAQAARGATEASAGEEYFKLFIGVGRGEVVPFASFYLTGFLHERPLMRVREDLARLGLERQPDVFEPEDHAASLLEVMAGLVGGSFESADPTAARAFFQRHLKPWIGRLFADIATAESAGFYRAVAHFAALWIEIETIALDLPE